MQKRMLILISAAIMLAACAASGSDADLTVKQPPSSQRMIVLHNTSSQAVLLNHPAPDPGASAGWASKLKPKHWSVLFLTNSKPRQHLFLITCHRPTDSHRFQTISCPKHLKHYILKPHFAKGHSKKGDFWLAEDKKKNKLQQALNKRHVNLKKQQLKRLGIASNQS